MRATTIEGQNHFALRTKFHVRDSHNTRNQITSDRRSRRAWSYCVLCITFILSGSPNHCWLHTWDARAIATWRLGLRAPLVPRNKFVPVLTGNGIENAINNDLKRMIVLKINISKTIAGHWLIKARVLCNALNFMIFSGGVMLHTSCFTPVYVNRSHLNEHNKLNYERDSVLEETSRGLKSGYVHIIPHTSF